MARRLDYVATVPELLDAIIVFTVLGIALYLAHLDARNRKGPPPIIWPDLEPKTGPLVPAEPAVASKRGLEVLPRASDEADTRPPDDDARTQQLTDDQLQTFHARLAAMRRASSTNR